MSIFSSIMSKIFHHVAVSQNPSTSAPVPPSSASAGSSTETAPAPTSAPAQPVDVGAVLTQMAAQKGGGGNWQTSIVDLLKLLDLDSSLDARKHALP